MAKSQPGDFGVLPARIPMDIKVAALLLWDAEYTIPYEAAYIRWPNGLPLPNEQIYYIFHMDDDKFIAVGTKDRSVTRLNLPGAWPDTSGISTE